MQTRRSPRYEMRQVQKTIAEKKPKKGVLKALRTESMALIKWQEQKNMVFPPATKE